MYINNTDDIMEKKFKYYSQRYKHFVSRLWCDNIEKRWKIFEKLKNKEKLAYDDQKGLILYDGSYIFNITNPNPRIIKLAAQALVNTVFINAIYVGEINFSSSWGSNNDERRLFIKETKFPKVFFEEYFRFSKIASYYYKYLETKNFVETFSSCKIIKKELEKLNEFLNSEETNEMLNEILYIELNKESTF